MIYLDNSASTFVKPKQVISSVYNAMTKYTANPGRSGHKLSMLAEIEVENVRNKVCEFFNSSYAVFTQNCTDALNLAIQGTFKQGGHIICTVNDHNSSVRPFFELQQKYGLEISVAYPKENGKLTLDDITPLVKPNTYLICVNQMSNVDGEIADIKAIGEFCYENCITFLVDGAQSVGHLKIDMQKNYIDMLAIAPHKGLYALQGIGILCFTKKAKLEPIRFGGTGTEGENTLQPISGIERYESGTLATPNIISVGSGIDFVKKHFDEIEEKIDDLSTFLNYELSNINDVKVYTHPNNAYGVIGFNIKDYGSTDVSQLLNDRFSICTRGGLHCAGLKHKFLGTLEQGIVRASISYFNTYSECEKLVKAVKILAK